VKQGDYSSWNVLFENRMNRSGQPASVSGASAARAEVRYQVRIESEAAISKQAALLKSVSCEAGNDECSQKALKYAVGSGSSAELP
jgi:hypothetical protein